MIKLAKIHWHGNRVTGPAGWDSKRRHHRPVGPEAVRGDGVAVRFDSSRKRTVADPQLEPQGRLSWRLWSSSTFPSSTTQDREGDRV